MPSRDVDRSPHAPGAPRAAFEITRGDEGLTIAGELRMADAANVWRSPNAARVARDHGHEVREHRLLRSQDQSRKAAALRRCEVVTFEELRRGAARFGRHRRR
jgi:hypothetical protein